MKRDLGIILVLTRWDDHTLVNQKIAELDASLGSSINYLVFVIDGDKTPDLSICLNQGIKAAIESECLFVHWLHLDFSFDDNHWFHVLRNILKEFPQVLKICASNSRDTILDWRIGQEQSWIMRCSDFVKYKWLWFDTRYKNIGGVEDWSQSLVILGHGKLVVVTPECTIHHAGAQTRSKKDTNADQVYNQGVFAQLTGYGQLVEVHQKQYFGIFAGTEGRNTLFNDLDPKLRKLLNFDVLPDRPFCYKTPTQMEVDLFPR